MASSRGRADRIGSGAHSGRPAIQLRQLRYFVKIVDAGSFSRAAATIYVAQPALSAQIAELEEELGVVLLNRSARGVKPTAAGEALYREAGEILGRVARVPDVVRYTGGELSGAVSLGMSTTLAALMGGALLKECKARLPLVTPSFVAEDSATLKTRIAAGTLDLAILFDEQPSPEVGHKALFRQRLYLVDSKAQPGNRKTIALQRLAELDLVLPGPGNVVRRQLDARFAAHGLVPRVVAEANELHAMLAAVQSRLGATILPLGEFDASMGKGALTATLIEPPLEQTARVVWSSSRALSRAGEAVRALLTPFVHDFIEARHPPGMVRIDD